MSNTTTSTMSAKAVAPPAKASLRTIPKAQSPLKKRKATGSHSKLTTEELERKRAISRRSSQRHRQREKIEVEEYKHKKDALVEANRKVKSDNASLKQVIQVLKANQAARAQQPPVPAAPTQQQLLQQALLATSGMANPNPGVTAPSLLARAASTPLPAAPAPAQAPEVVDLVALLAKAQQQKVQAAPAPPKPSPPAPHQSTLLRSIMAARQAQQQPQTSMSDASILATLQALQQQQQQQQQPTPQAVPSYAAPAPAAADLLATLQANAASTASNSANQLLASLQGMTAPVPAPAPGLYSAFNLLKNSMAPPAPVPSAPVPSPAMEAAAYAPTSALLQELVHRASGNPGAQREMLQMLLAQRG